MTRWENDPAFADFKAMAQKLEAGITAANAMLLKAANLTPEAVLPAFSQAQASLLGFDDHAKKRFEAALEDKRVITLSQSNIFMTCILSAAVALSEFKNQPQQAHGGMLSKALNKVRQHSTNSLSLGAFAWASFYAVLGKGLVHNAKTLRTKRKVIRAR